MLSGGHDDASVHVIEELLDDPDEACRVAGLDAIRRLGDPILLERVHPLLADPLFGVRVAALEAFAGAHDPAANVPDLIAALDDPVADVRVAAARILAAFETAPPGVVEVLATDSARAQAAALTALSGTARRCARRSSTGRAGGSPGRTTCAGRAWRRGDRRSGGQRPRPRSSRRSSRTASTISPTSRSAPWSCSGRRRPAA